MYIHMTEVKKTLDKRKKKEIYCTLKNYETKIHFKIKRLFCLLFQSGRMPFSCREEILQPTRQPIGDMRGNGPQVGWATCHLTTSRVSPTNLNSFILLDLSWGPLISKPQKGLSCTTEPQPTLTYSQVKCMDKDLSLTSLDRP